MKSWPALSGLLLATHMIATAPGAGAAERDPTGEDLPPDSALVAPDPAAAVLARELAQAIPSESRGEDRWSVLVVSLDGGDALFAHRAEEAMAPASNMKVFTSAAALHYLGPEYRYTTYLTATGPIRDGVLEGDLVVYGTGDPTFSRRSGAGGGDVWEALADSLVAAGVRQVAGDLVGDGSFFEGPAVGSGWQSSYISHAYAAPVGALSFNENVITIRVRPGAAVGAPPEVLILPAGTADLHVEMTTVAGGRSWVEIERESYTSPIVVVGQIQRGHAGLWRATPVVDPARFAISAFSQTLAGRGIEVGGAVRAIHDAEHSPVGGRRVFAPGLDGGPAVQVLAVQRSAPMQEILEVVNQRSNNLYAESVLRVVGRVATGRGSVAGGAEAIARMMDEGGASTATLVIDDGSGLSRSNRVSARSLVDMLSIMAGSPHHDAFAATLPEAATSPGLRRMQQTAAAANLRAKTGTIEGVSALSGYVTAGNGERLAFAIISNDVRSTFGAKRIEDRIGARLAAFDRPAPAVRGPAGPGRLARGPSIAVSDTAPAAAASPATASPAVASPAAAPPAAAAEPAEPAEPPGREPARAHTIQRGDTLEGIARRHGVTIEALRSANPGVRDRRLIPGRTLTVPAG
jgi:serine-type D-Ala-D-Ala carboxypeptidase/endopeptidase (penicillin-binding protein 4)